MQDENALPFDFHPSNDDVVCGRGSRVFMHPGNERFRAVVASRLPEYKKAESKIQKSYVICDVVEHIRNSSPYSGGFVKKCNKSGRWYRVGDFLAREKASQAFRDLLEEKYKSSNGNKRKKRAERMVRQHSSTSIAATAATNEATPTAKLGRSSECSPKKDQVAMNNIPSAKSILDDPFMLKEEQDNASSSSSSHNEEWSASLKQAPIAPEGVMSRSFDWTRGSTLAMAPPSNANTVPAATTFNRFFVSNAAGDNCNQPLAVTSSAPSFALPTIAPSLSDAETFERLADFVAISTGGEEKQPADIRASSLMLPPPAPAPAPQSTTTGDDLFEPFPIR